MVFRPDMTVPVARMDATKLKDVDTPMKLSYCSSIFRVHESFLGGRNEYLDCGVELIGVKDRLGDLEIITTAIETLKNVTNKSFKLDIGYVNILKTAMNEMGITENQQEYIADLIEKKSLISLSEYVKSLNINQPVIYYLLCTIPSTVHMTDPFHLVCSLIGCSFFRIFDKAIHNFLCLDINIVQMFMQFSTNHQGCIFAFLVFL